MRRRGDVAVALVLALLSHAALMVCAERCMQPQRLAPEFAAGISAVRLTLVAPPPRETEPEPVPTPSQPMAPLPELPPEPNLAPLPPVEPDEPVEEMVEQSITDVVAPADPESPAEAADADAEDKGVTTTLFDTAGVRPIYPMGSRLRGEEGLVQLRVRVDSSGRAVDVQVTASSGFPSLDRAAVKAAQRARYRAVDGTTGSGVITLPIRFQLTAP